MIEHGDIHSFEIPTPAGPKYLCIGIRKGEVRPSMWLSVGTHEFVPESVVLGRFFGVQEAEIAVDFMNGMVNEVNRAIQFHGRNARKNPDE